MNKLKTSDSSYFIGKSHFDEDGTPNYSLFQPIIRYFKLVTSRDNISYRNLKDYLLKLSQYPQHMIVALFQN